MVTISHMVGKLVDEKVLLQEAIGQGIVSYGSVAKQLKPDIEKELKREVAHYAVVTALRRYAEKINGRYKQIKFDNKNSEVNLKTNIVYINIIKTKSLFNKLKQLYDIINFENGDILHIIYGNSVVSVVTNERYKDQICNSLHFEKIISINSRLVALSFSIDIEFMNTPGILFQIVRHFAWQNINIIDFVSIENEMIFIVEENDAIIGYKALKKLISK
jgi:aspartokinase